MDLKKLGLFCFFLYTAITAEIGLNLQNKLQENPSGVFRVIVTLKNQPEIRENYTAKKSNYRSIKLNEINLMKTQCQTKQNEIINFLHQFENVTQIKSFSIFNGLAITTTQEVINQLNKRKDVDTITLVENKTSSSKIQHREKKRNRVQTPAQFMNADLVKEADNLQADGSGLLVALVDSGISQQHIDNGEFLADTLRSKSFVANETDPFSDGFGTGSFSAGLIASQSFGIVTGATLVSTKVIDADGNFNIEDVIDGVEDATFTAVADVVYIGISITPGTDTKPLEQAVKNAAKFTIVVVPVGDAGPDPKTTQSPGNVTQAITVGSIDATTNNIVGVIPDFSSRGPQDPDFGAPGVDIESLAGDRVFEPGVCAFSSTTHASAALMTAIIVQILQIALLIGDSPINSKLMEKEYKKPAARIYGKGEFQFNADNLPPAEEALGLNRNTAIISKHPQQKSKTTIQPNEYYQAIVSLKQDLDIDSANTGYWTNPKENKKQIQSIVERRKQEYQSALMKKLHHFKSSGKIREIHPFNNINAISIVATGAAITELKQHQDVQHVAIMTKYKQNIQLRPISERKTTRSQTPLQFVKSDLLAESAGVLATGNGINIAIIDSGISQQHIDDNEVNVDETNSISFVDGEDFNEDGAGTGSFSAGLIGSTSFGVVPDATLVVIKVTSNAGVVSPEDVIAGIDHALGLGVDVIYIGVSIDPDVIDTKAMETAVKNAAKQTIVVVPAGDNGPDFKTLLSPGTVSQAMVITAFDTTNSDTFGNVPDFASRGPKSPDFSAPGVDVESLSGDAFADPSIRAILSSTHAAAPLAAGVSAQILELAQRTSTTDLSTTKKMEKQLKKFAIRFKVKNEYDAILNSFGPAREFLLLLREKQLREGR